MKDVIPKKKKVDQVVCDISSTWGPFEIILINDGVVAPLLARNDVPPPFT